MKNLFWCLCLIFLSNAAFGQENSPSPQSETWQTMSQFPWGYDETSDVWVKDTFGHDSIPLKILMIEKKLTTDFLGNSVITGASFSALVYCGSDHSTQVFTWSAGEESGTWTDCDHLEWQVSLPPSLRLTVCPLPAEIQKAIGGQTLCSIY